MARWEPNAQERLQEAAMALFEERGYDRTTVSDIAKRANLADRTFFRYFSDKREVLFSRSEAVEKLMVDAVVNAPTAATPLQVVVAALEATSSVLESRRAFARRRQALIAAHAELHERELIKTTKLAGAIAAGLRGRGVDKARADLLASTGMLLFLNAFERWVEDDKKRDLAHHVREALAELQLLTAATGTVKRRAGRAARG
jgi:AcrR family transcriptional regulator